MIMCIKSARYSLNPKGKEMKKSVRLSLIIVSAIAVVSTTVAASTFFQSKEKLYELEKAARLQNLSVIADRKSTRLNSSHIPLSRMPSSA